MFAIFSMALTSADIQLRLNLVCYILMSAREIVVTAFV